MCIVLSSPWFYDTGGTERVLTALQQYGTTNTRLFMAELIASLNLSES
jgi:hypothetical protein